jgi:transposase
MEEQVQRWTFKRKAEIVISILKNEVTMQDVCRKNDLTHSEVQKWMDDFIKGGEQNLKTNASEVKNEYEVKIKEMKEKIGDLVLELEARKKLQALQDLKGMTS